MQPPAQSQPRPTSESFAGLLATLASPTREEADDAAEWSGGDLGDDVVTLSYERALRAHARSRPADTSGWPVPQAWRAEASDAERAMTLPATRVNEELSAEAFEARQSTNDRNLRSASVTIRLSKAECARLHRRATEAGVTISAYMRSCTFEAETLRAQVKAALAELKAAASKEKPVAPAKERRTFLRWVAFGWLARFLPRRRSARQAC
jgi:hypothetical protein